LGAGADVTTPGSLAAVASVGAVDEKADSEELDNAEPLLLSAQAVPLIATRQIGPG
jgi:hypothetical protein